MSRMPDGHGAQAPAVPVVDYAQADAATLVGCARGAAQTLRLGARSACPIDVHAQMQVARLIDALAAHLEADLADRAQREQVAQDARRWRTMISIANETVDYIDANTAFAGALLRHPTAGDDSWFVGPFIARREVPIAVVVAQFLPHDSLALGDSPEAAIDAAAVAGGADGD